MPSQWEKMSFAQKVAYEVKDFKEAREKLEIELDYKDLVQVAQIIKMHELKNEIMMLRVAVEESTRK
jgi:hypothetical protein